MPGEFEDAGQPAGAEGRGASAHHQGKTLATASERGERRRGNGGGRGKEEERGEREKGAEVERRRKERRDLVAGEQRG